MSWATNYVHELNMGEIVKFRPKGGSMAGKIESGQLVTVIPSSMKERDEVKVGDIVLCKVNGNHYLHLIKDISLPYYQIGNNKGKINGWILSEDIFGFVIKVED